MSALTSRFGSQNIWQIPVPVKIHDCLNSRGFLDVYLLYTVQSLKGFFPEHLVQPRVKQTVPNMSCSAAVNLLVCYGHGSVVLVPRKLIHWYVTSVGLLAVYPNKARAPPFVHLTFSDMKRSNWKGQTARGSLQILGTVESCSATRDVCLLSHSSWANVWRGMGCSRREPLGGSGRRK